MTNDEELAEAHQAIAAALAWFPHLTACGLKPSVPCDPLDPARCATAIAFLRCCEYSAKATRLSYGLKHDAEACSQYVANGELIAAAGLARL